MWSARYDNVLCMPLSSNIPALKAPQINCFGLFMYFYYKSKYRGWLFLISQWWIPLAIYYIFLHVNSGFTRAVFGAIFDTNLLAKPRMGFIKEEKYKFFFPTLFFVVHTWLWLKKNCIKTAPKTACINLS